MRTGSYLSEGPSGLIRPRPVIQDGSKLIDPDTGAILVDGQVPEGILPGCFLPDSSKAEANAKAAAEAEAAAKAAAEAEAAAEAAAEAEAAAKAAAEAEAAAKAAAEAEARKKK